MTAITSTLDLLVAKADMVASVSCLQGARGAVEVRKIT